MPWAPSPWKSWVEHIEDKKSNFGFKKAALVHDNGAVASATRGFTLSPREVKVSINNSYNTKQCPLLLSKAALKTIEMGSFQVITMFLISLPINGVVIGSSSTYISANKN